MCPEYSTCVCVKTIDLTGQIVRTSQKKTILPDDGGTHTVPGDLGLPEDTLSLFGIPIQWRIRVSGLSVGTRPPKTGPALQDMLGTSGGARDIRIRALIRLDSSAGVK
jgi:hypothetical protein